MAQSGEPLENKRLPVPHGRW